VIAVYIAACAVVGVIATTLMPDYTGKDISKEYDSEAAGRCTRTRGHRSPPRPPSSTVAPARSCWPPTARSATRSRRASSTSTGSGRRSWRRRAEGSAHPELGGVDPAELRAYFVKSGRYTAGVATHHRHLAKGCTIGMRFHWAPVVRWADAKPMQLGHAALADFLAESAKSPIGAARRPQPTSTASSTFVPSSSRNIATSRSRRSRRCRCRARDASG